jgi:hypothetical protein
MEEEEVILGARWDEMYSLSFIILACMVELRGRVSQAGLALADRTRTAL